MTYHAEVISEGKIVIPADLRRVSGIRDADTLVIEREPDGGLSIKTFDQVVREASATSGPDYTVDQLIRGNHADWDREARSLSSMLRPPCP